MNICNANPKDFDKLEEILIENDMLNYPEIDGKQAMQKVYEIMGRYFLVCKTNNEVLGLIRGCYDGSRALIHQIAIKKQYQRQGIGKKLIKELTEILKQDGAKSVAVTSGKDSREYFQSLGFKDINVRLMIREN